MTTSTPFSSLHQITFPNHQRQHRPCTNLRRRRKPRPLSTSPQATSSPTSSPSEIDLQAKLQNSIAVIGGGPAGLATALALQKIGLPAIVLERDPGPSTIGSALGLWTNAWKALDALGAAEPLRAQHPIIDRVELCRQNNRVLKSFSLSQCEGGPHEFRGVRRSSLNAALTAQLQPGSIIYNTPIIGVDGVGQTSTSQQGNLSSNRSGAVLQTEAGERLTCLAAVGADGVRGASVAAAGRQLARYVGQVAIRGVAEFPRKDLPCDCIRQIWSVGPRAGMYPISGTELYWFVCFDAAPDAPIPSTQEAIQQEASRVVEGWGWELSTIIASTPLGSFSRSRIADRWTLPSSSSLPTSKESMGGGRKLEKPLLTLAGDALHPMTPNLGQGGCTSLEDAVVLGRLMKQGNIPSLFTPTNNDNNNYNYSSIRSWEDEYDRIQTVFQQYENERLQRCLPLTVRSFAFGAALQLPVPPVAWARDFVVGNFFNPSHFLDHATYDCGKL